MKDSTKKNIAFNVFDDICIYASDWQKLMENLEFVLKSLKEANLTLTLKIVNLD